MKLWLMKSEPDVYSIDDLARDGRTSWEGVRNYTARNYLRDEMKLGDLVLFYHSGSPTPAVVGIARVCREAYPDPTQFDPKSAYFDPGARREAPRWMTVDVEFVEKLRHPVPLATLRKDGRLAGMPLLQKGQRLSVQPVSPAHFRRVLAHAGARFELPRTGR